MGAGQVGGMATLLDIDFNNAAGFIGVKSDVTEAQFVVYYLSHAMLFCMGALIEAHVVLTPASCVFGERYKFDVFGGTHRFIENAGIERTVEHIALHKGYNHTARWDESCSPDNVALLMLNQQFLLHSREQSTEYIMNRLRYGVMDKFTPRAHYHTECKFYGWGSRRNGYLIPLLIHLRRVDVNILSSHNCPKMWNNGDKYLCLEQFTCKSEKHGALCPDDLGSVVECSGFLRGMMTSRLIDRPCGVGFLDMVHYSKFLTCGVDDARDILGHDDLMEFEFGKTTVKAPDVRINVVTIANQSVDEIDANDPGAPTTRSTVSGEETETPPGQAAISEAPLDQDLSSEKISGQEANPEIPPGQSASKIQEENKPELSPGQLRSRISPPGYKSSSSDSDEEQDDK